MSATDAPAKGEQLLRDKHVEFVKGFESIVRTYLNSSC